MSPTTECLYERYGLLNFGSSLDQTRDDDIDAEIRVAPTEQRVQEIAFVITLEQPATLQSPASQGEGWVGFQVIPVGGDSLQPLSFEIWAEHEKLGDDKAGMQISFCDEPECEPSDVGSRRIGEPTPVRVIWTGDMLRLVVADRPAVDAPKNTVQSPIRCLTCTQRKPLRSTSQKTTSPCATKAADTAVSVRRARRPA